MAKTKVDLGNQKDNWTPEQINQLEIILDELYPGHFPEYLSAGEIVDDILEKYEIISSSPGAIPRSSFGLYCKLQKIKEKKNPIQPFKKDGFIAIREWLSGEAIRRLKLDYNIVKSIISKSERTASVIMLKQVKEYAVFFYPTITYADYARIFYDIFSLTDQNEDNNRRIDDNRFGNAEGRMMWECWDNEEWISIKNPESEITRLHALYYFLDYCLSFLASNIILHSQEYLKKDGKNSDYRMMEKLLESFKENGYTFFKEEDFLAALNGKRIIDKEGRNYLEIMKKIQKELDNNVIYLPKYTIQMSRVFELYAYSVLRKEHKGLLFKKKLDDKSDYTPDMCTKKCDHIIDAKYKFQYRERDYCNLNDMYSMIVYYVQKQEPRICSFVYPDMRQNALDIAKRKNDVLKLQKIGIKLPIRKYSAL